MTWYLIVESATGRLLSQTERQDRIADPLPEGLALLTLAERPSDDQMWAEATRSFVPRPLPVLVDRLQDLVQHPDFAAFKTAVWDRLTAAQKTALQDALIKLLGLLRWRESSQPVVLVPEPEGSP